MRKARQAKFDRLADAADVIGISIGYLSMIENGLIPNQRLRGLIADALEVAPSKLWPGVAG